MKSKHVLDASAVLVLINEEFGYEKVIDYLPDACISTVNLSEIATILQGITMPDNEIRLLLRGLIPKIISFDELQAYQVANLRNSTKSFGLSLGDRACLALGIMHSIPVVTADKTWAKLDLGIQVVLIR